jgi:hypothetical protein
VELLRGAVRILSYAYHGLLALFLLGISFLAIATNSHTLQLGMLPWSGKTLSYTVFFGALFGIVSVVLAMRGQVRFLFFAWSLAVALFLLKGYVFSSYSLQPGELSTAVALGAGALVALAGAWFQLRKKPDRRGYY